MPENFKARNEQLLKKYLHLVKRIDHVKEQINRNVDHLDLKFALPDYYKEMKILNDFATRNFKLIGSGALLGAGAASTGYYFYDKNKKLNKQSDDYVPPSVDTNKNRLGQDEKILEKIKEQENFITKDYERINSSN